MAAALSRGELPRSLLNEPEQELLQWVALLTKDSASNTDADVAKLRSAGWNDAQIAEAAYITALFAFFNRVADAFGLEDWKP